MNGDVESILLTGRSERLPYGPFTGMLQPVPHWILTNDEGFNF
jgi:hypothetical protein